MVYFDKTSKSKLSAGTRFISLENGLFSFCLATPIWPHRKRSIFALNKLSLFFSATYPPINKEVWYRVSLLIALGIRWPPCELLYGFLTCTSILLCTCGSSWQTPPCKSEFLCFEFKFSLLAVNREFKKTTTTMATGTSLNKRYNDQNNGCARVLYNFWYDFFVVLYKNSVEPPGLIFKIHVSNLSL